MSRPAGRYLAAARLGEAQPVHHEVDEESPVVGEELGEGRQVGQFLGRELRLDLGLEGSSIVLDPGIRLRGEAKAGHRFTADLELDPPHVALRVEERRGTCSEEGKVALVVTRAALTALVVEAGEDSTTRAKTITRAASAFEVGVPLDASRLDETSDFACIEGRSKSALPVDVQVE